MDASAFGMKAWRRPTLAEPIEPLPSAMLCLTAEFGMGSGRATALWSPKNQWRVMSGLAGALDLLHRLACAWGAKLLKNRLEWFCWPATNHQPLITSH